MEYQYINAKVFFLWLQQVSYPEDVKMKAIEMRLAGVPVKVVLAERNIKNVS